MHNAQYKVQFKLKLVDLTKVNRDLLEVKFSKLCYNYFLCSNILLRILKILRIFMEYTEWNRDKEVYGKCMDLLQFLLIDHIWPHHLHHPQLFIKIQLIFHKVHYPWPMLYKRMPHRLRLFYRLYRKPKIHLFFYSLTLYDLKILEAHPC